MSEILPPSMAFDNPQQYMPGSLVMVRGRHWVVTTSDYKNVVRLRPVDGSDEDAIGVFATLRQDIVKQSQYDDPDPLKTNDLGGAMLLKDAMRFMLRNGAGPFRSLGQLSITPRPYQFVPLIMALRLDTIRLLIADDVGVGKTIEAAMIARELLDRGLISRVCVLCPPHLCEQWGDELRGKFGIETAIVQSSRIARLERGVPRSDTNIYQYYKHLVVSIDYVKSDRNRGFFVANAPELVIVDEAHSATRSGEQSRNQQQRYALLQELAKNPNRHIILVTATPHSGIEGSFRSLLGLINPSFDVDEATPLPKAKLVPHIVQRRRQDLEKWMGEETPFPQRQPLEEYPYSLSPEYQRLFGDVLEYCRGTVQSETHDNLKPQQRVRYWAAVAILRCILSSPAAAESVLINHQAKKSKVKSEEEVSIEHLAGETMDSTEDEEPSDYVPSADIDMELTAQDTRKLDGFLNTAKALRSIKLDRKLARVALVIRDMLKQGSHPIVYCRYIATANYVADSLQSELRKDFPGICIRAVTSGEGDSEKRKEIVDELGQADRRVLVATECLSEGINLQESFDAVIHYDLPWNPNRLEQREGRVDRYGQKAKTIRRALIYGADNPIDTIVLSVLIRKAGEIRKSLGVSVPVPVDSESVIQAIIDNVLIWQPSKGPQLQFDLQDARVSKLHDKWGRFAQAEGEARAFFAQHGIRPEEVAKELKETDPILGDTNDLLHFLSNSIQRLGGSLKPVGKDGNVYRLDPGNLASKISARAPHLKFPLDIAFCDIPPKGVLRVGRTNPIIATVADAVIAKSLVEEDLNFARSGAIYSSAVTLRTVILVLRLRYLLQEKSDHFAEEIVLASFRYDATKNGLVWLKPFREQSLVLLQEPGIAGNMAQPERVRQVEWALATLKQNKGWHDDIVAERVNALGESHRRLSTQIKTSSLNVKPHLPPDIIGCYVLVPAGGAS